VAGSVPTTTVGSESRTCWNLNNSAEPQECLETTRAEQVAAALAQLPKSGADRDGDPGAGYGARCECKFDLANQNNNVRSVAENRGHVQSPPAEHPRSVDMCPSDALEGPVKDIFGC